MAPVRPKGEYAAAAAAAALRRKQQHFDDVTEGYTVSIKELFNKLDVDMNAFGEEAIGVLADAIEKDAMPSLIELALPSPHELIPRLIAACKRKGVKPI